MVKNAMALGLLLGLSWSRPTDACINPMRLSKDAGVQRVAEAQRQLDAGASDEARAALDPEDNVRKHGVAPFDADDPALEARATLIAVTAWLRTATAPEHRQVVDTLEALRRHDHDPDHPLLLARLAEALAGGGATEQARARTMLADLEARDLLPDAEAAAVLARLHAAAGDQAGAARVQARCVQLARRPGQCPTVDGAARKPPRLPATAKKPRRDA